MNFAKTCFAIWLLGIAFPGCAQKANEKTRLGLAVAKEELKTALADSPQYNLTDSRKILIADSSTAVQVAELILFKSYGKAIIIKEQPCEIYLINHYWVVNGTLPKGWLGGALLNYSGCARWTDY